MVLAPNDLFSWNNKYNKYNEYNVTDTFTRFFLSCARTLTLCMLASWSHEGVVFLDFSSSSHSITSSLYPFLGSTDNPCSRLGDPYPLSPKWRPHSQGPRTLPYRDPEQLEGQTYSYRTNSFRKEAVAQTIIQFMELTGCSLVDNVCSYSTYLYKPILCCIRFTYLDAYWNTSHRCSCAISRVYCIYIHVLSRFKIWYAK